MKLMFETMGAEAERGMSNPGTLRGVRPVGPTEIDELKRFQHRAALNLGYEERRGAQAIGEAALHVLSGLREQVGLDGACDQTFEPCPDFGSLLAITAVDGSQQALCLMLDAGLPVRMDSALHQRATAATKVAAAYLVAVSAKPDAIDGQGEYLAIEQIFLGAGVSDALSSLLGIDAVSVGLNHLPTLPRHNTSGNQFGTGAGVKHLATSLAADFVGQLLLLLCKEQVAWGHVPRAHGAGVKRLTKRLQFGEGGGRAHAAVALAERVASKSATRLAIAPHRIASCSPHHWLLFIGGKRLQP